MPLQERLIADLKEAMKAGKTELVGVLRMISAAIQNRQIEKGKDSKLSEEDILQIFIKEAKKRKEAAEAFKKGGRLELAQKEQNELLIIEAYLPKQMSREELVAAVEKILFSLSDKSNFGLVMKELMKELKGKADAKLISEIVKEKLR